MSKRLLQWMCLLVLGFLGESIDTPSRLTMAAKNPAGPTVNPPLRISYQGRDDAPNFVPEPSIAVGEKTLVVAMNFRVTGYRKDNPGSMLFSSSFVGFYDQFRDHNFFDPVAIYDSLYNRYFVVAIANKYDINSSRYAIAISRNRNPTTQQDWCFYYADASRFGQTQENFAADRISATSSTGYLYISANMHEHSATDLTAFSHAKISVLDFRNYDTQTCNGSSVNGIDIRGLTHHTSVTMFGIQNVKIDQTGTPYYVCAAGGGNNFISIFSFGVGLDPGSGTRIRVDVPFYSPISAIRQPGGGMLENRNGTRIMQAELRNGVVWSIQHSADTNQGGTNTGLRIYAYTLAGGTLFTQVREDSGRDFSFGAIAVNANDEALIAFNTSSPTNEFISIRYAAFESSSDEVKAGEGIASVNRWGDYTLMTTDPNDIDFWLVHMYAKANGQVGIWIASTAKPLHELWIPMTTK